MFLFLDEGKIFQQFALFPSADFKAILCAIGGLHTTKFKEYLLWHSTNDFTIAAHANASEGFQN